MKLAYQAYNTAGRTVSDTIDAASADEAKARLRRQGLFVTQIDRGTSSNPASRASAHRRMSGTRRLKQLAMFTRQLYVLASTGTPLVDSLGALQRQTRDPAWHDVIGQLKHRVEEGAPLSEAMVDYPQFFDPVYRSLIAAGESGGQFGPMLDRLAQLVRKQLHVRSSIGGAMVYPALLLTVALSVLVLMLTFVLPRFANLFHTLDLPLPVTTRFMIAISDALRSYWWLMVTLLIGLGVGGLHGLRSAKGREMLDTLLIRLPVMGAAARSFATARVTRLLGTLMVSHVPMLDALALVRQGAGNVHYARLIDRAEAAVTRGEPISTAFADDRLISPAVYEAVRSGEATGQVGVLLLNVAEFLEEDNEVVLRTLTSILEPVILVILGLLVGAVALSMFLPLFDLTASAGG